MNLSEDPDVAFKKSMFVASQTPDWVGRTVAGLLTDPKVHKKAGRVNWVYDVSIYFTIKSLHFEWFLREIKNLRKL